MTCKLFLKDLPLADSHIISEFTYDPLAARVIVDKGGGGDKKPAPPKPPPA